MSDKQTAGIGKGTPGPGRPKGQPNRATSAVREAFRRLVEDNAEHLQDWLEAVAKDDPGEALSLTARIAEFVIPKLSRSELHGGGDDGRLIIEIIKQGTPPPGEPSCSEANE